MTYYLTWDDLQTLHKLVGDQADEGGYAGGETGSVRDENAIRSALARPKNFSRFKPNCTLFDRAAALFEGLIRQQGFVDGNKRTAILATHAFLRLNGYDFRPSKGELLRYTQEIANEDSGPELERIAAMIENNSAPLDE